MGQSSYFPHCDDFGTFKRKFLVTTSSQTMLSVAQCFAAAQCGVVCYWGDPVLEEEELLGDSKLHGS